WLTDVPDTADAPSPKDQSSEVIGPGVASEKVTGWPTVAPTGETEYDTAGSAGARDVIRMAKGSPDALSITVAKAMIGTSLVTSAQRFVSVRPETSGKSGSSRAFWKKPSGESSGSVAVE